MLLRKEQLSTLKEKTDNMLAILKTYDISQSAKFTSFLKMISDNISECIRCEFDGLEELSRYIKEDWRSACLGKQGIENWHLKNEDINIQAKSNKDFEELALSVDRILGTGYLVPRTWYTYDDLEKIARDFRQTKNSWENSIAILKKQQFYETSPLKGVPDDIWSYAKFCLAVPDSTLKEWFFQEIPAFGYLSVMGILHLEDGEDIVRSFFCSVTV